MIRYRHEMKYLIDYKEYALIRARVGHVLAKDTHVDSDGFYTVRSLYFDDYNNFSYNDKYAGVLNRTKYRIRIYNYSDKRINFERKNKYERYNHKQTALMTRAQVESVLQGDYSKLLENKDNLLGVFYHECVSNLLRPRVVVDYEREPFIMEAGDVRITFDKNIRAGVEGFDIFNPQLPTVEALDPGLLVMEVKYTEFLPNVVRMILPTSAANYTTLSKYVVCCDKTEHLRSSYV